MPPGVATGWLVLCGLLGAAALAWRYRLLRTTTLIGPWRWSVLALLALVACEGAVAGAGAAASSWRFLAATITFCPLVALLGAKRPQDRGWSFVVLTLWIVVSLPAVQSLVLRPGEPLGLHDARGWFLVILIGMGVANAAPTRNWSAALVFAAGQVLLLAPYLPLVQEWLPQARSGIGLGLCVAAGGLAAWRYPLAAPQADSIDRAWRDFRDLYGTLWGVRVMERINAATQAADSLVRLQWSGFDLGPDRQWRDLDARERTLLATSLHNALRRFVDDDWLRDRVGELLELPSDRDASSPPHTLEKAVL